MSEEKTQIVSNAGSDNKKIQTLDARNEQLLQRKDQAEDSFVKKHIDYLLLEVEDLMTKYDHSVTTPGRTKK